MLVPEAAVKVQLDSPAPLSASPPPTHTPSKRHWGTKHNILAKRVGFIHPNQATQSQSHRHRLDQAQDEDEYEHEDDEYDEDRRRPNTAETAAPGASSQNGFSFFFSRAAAKLLKSFSLWEISTTLFLFGSFTMPNEKWRKCCRVEATRHDTSRAWLVIYLCTSICYLCSLFDKVVARLFRWLPQETRGTVWEGG